MTSQRSTRLAVPVVVLLLLAAAGLACSGGSTSTPGPATPAASSAPAETSAPSAAGAVTSLDEVKSATVMVQAEGAINEPGVGEVQEGWSGSGFLIDPSGLIVTNNHVVTGAALLKVRVGGEGDWHNAKILGVSECSDLAVIKIEGSGYPYLQWRSGTVKVGLNMYVGGYPLGDPEYTLVRGIVSKEKADGKTSWTSVESVVEYDAATNPGSSGGPVVDDNGQVIAVNFAGSATTRQAFGIARAAAEPVIEQLQTGKDVDSIGVNGEAFVNQDKTLAGIWVSSVASGSPADKAGVKGGDIITRMEGLTLGTDGTKGSYCDILRSHKASDTLALEVVRFGTGEVLAGQLNGRVLATSVTFDSGAATPGAGGGGATAGSYSGYVTVRDDHNSIEVEIPKEWTQIDGSAWVDGGDTIGASIAAAPDLTAFNNFKESGVIFEVSDDLAKLGGYVQVLDVVKSNIGSMCKFDSRVDYTEDPAYRGKADIWRNCEGGDNTYVVISAVPRDNSQAYIILVHVVMTREADQEALTHIINSFQVIGTLP